ncbi:SAM-dependent methyltransferase, partial [Peribacillus sp. NPDC056705]
MSRAEERQDKTKQELDRVVFIGRTYEEYMQMFDLQLPDLVGKKILDCPAGACSFTSYGVRNGLDVTASDIAYDHKVDDLERKGLQD